MFALKKHMHGSFLKFLSNYSYFKKVLFHPDVNSNDLTFSIDVYYIFQTQLKYVLFGSF